MKESLGNANTVRRDLEKKVAEGNEPVTVAKNEAGGLEVVKATAKVKLTDVIIAVIEGAAYLPEDLKALLLADINAKLVKTTSAAKPSVKGTVHEMLLAAGEAGITKDAMVNQFMAKTPTPSTSELISFVTNLNFFVQPSFYKKEGWNVFVKEGGFYGIAAKK